MYKTTWVSCSDAGLTKKETNLHARKQVLKDGHARRIIVYAYSHRGIHEKKYIGAHKMTIEVSRCTTTQGLNSDIDKAVAEVSMYAKMQEKEGGNAERTRVKLSEYSRPEFLCLVL